MELEELVLLGIPVVIGIILMAILILIQLDDGED